MADRRVGNVIYPSAFARAQEERAQSLFREADAIDLDSSRYEEAIAIYRQAIALKPAFPEALTNLGNIRFRQGRIDLATLHFQKAIEIDESQVDAVYNMGYCLHSEGRLVEVILWYSRALKLDPNFANAHFNLASALDGVGRHSDARKHWRKYVKLEPQGEWALHALAQIQRVQAL